MGRPSEYDPKVAENICELIATTSLGLQRLCREYNLPDPKTIYKWMNANPIFLQQYTHAKELQVQVLADEMIDIADTTQVGEIITQKPDGSSEIKTADMIEHRKLRIESRKWLMGKLKPKVYGDKQQLEVSGELNLADRISKARQREERMRSQDAE